MAALPAGAQQVCPNPNPVPPQINPDSGLMCHPSACTPHLCDRGDIAPLSTHATQALQDRLVLIDCSSAQRDATSSICRSGHQEPLVPVLPARLHGLSTERADDQDPWDQ